MRSGGMPKPQSSIVMIRPWLKKPGETTD